MIKLDQPWSNLIKLDQTWSNLIKLVQTWNGSNLIRFDQTWLNWIKMDSIGLKLIRTDQTCSNMFKHDQTWLVFVPFLIIIGRLFKLITSLLVSSIGGSLVTWKKHFQNIKINQFCRIVICMNIKMLRYRIFVLVAKYFANKNIGQIFRESYKNLKQSSTFLVDAW